MAHPHKLQKPRSSFYAQDLYTSRTTLAQPSRPVNLQIPSSTSVTSTSARTVKHENSTILHTKASTADDETIAVDRNYRNRSIPPCTSRLKDAAHA